MPRKHYPPPPFSPPAPQPQILSIAAFLPCLVFFLLVSDPLSFFLSLPPSAPCSSRTDTFCKDDSVELHTPDFPLSPSPLHSPFEWVPLQKFREPRSSLVLLLRRDRSMRATPPLRNCFFSSLPPPSECLPILDPFTLLLLYGREF